MLRCVCRAISINAGANKAESAGSSICRGHDFPDDGCNLMKNDKLKYQYRANERIHAREVRVVGEGIETAVMPTRDALFLAESKGLDLVEISPTAVPPVCRIVDYSKFLYQQKKRQKEMRAKQVKIEVKEIRFGPQTDDHDYNFKLKYAKEFLSDGNKVKAYVFFRGRSILFKEQGEILLLRFANDLEDYGKVEQMPVLEGKRMTIFLAPKKAKGGNAQSSKSVQSAAATQKAEAAEEAKKTQKENTRKEYKAPTIEGE